MGVGMPQALFLEEFGSQVWHAFGTPPYLVGSALKAKTWRDVDVRLILSDEAWEAWRFGDPTPSKAMCNGRWVALCLAFSALGKQMTGLPIDFQIQQRTHANKAYEKQPRSSLGRVDPRMVKL